MKRALRPLIIGLSTVIAPQVIWAQAPKNITSGEMTLLPEYCRDTQSFGYGNQYFNPSPRAPHWVSLMGPTFWDLHHYCWALIKRRRALQPGVNPVLRAGGLKASNGDLNYVLTEARRRGQADFILAPELLTLIGDNSRDMGDYAGAIGAYEGAIKQKPDYWPPYLRWAEMLQKAGSLQLARQRIEDGLRAVPESKQLREKYKELGGEAESFLRSLPPAAASAAASEVGK